MGICTMKWNLRMRCAQTLLVQKRYCIISANTLFLSFVFLWQSNYETQVRSMKRCNELFHSNFYILVALLTLVGSINENIGPMK